MRYEKQQKKKAVIPDFILLKLGGNRSVNYSWELKAVLMLLI